MIVYNWEFLNNNEHWCWFLYNQVTLLDFLLGPVNYWDLLIDWRDKNCVANVSSPASRHPWESSHFSLSLSLRSRSHIKNEWIPGHQFPRASLGSWTFFLRLIVTKRSTNFTVMWIEIQRDYRRKLRQLSRKLDRSKVDSVAGNLGVESKKVWRI